MSRCFLVTLLLSALSAACGSSSPSQGGVGQACFPNGTCNAGLACLSNLCVNATGAGGAAGTSGAAGTGVAGKGGAGGTSNIGGASGVGGGAGSGGGAAGTSGSAGTAGGAGAGCPSPSQLHPAPSGTTVTLSCPFSGVDGGAAVSCQPESQHCCQSGSTGGCQPLATACASSAVDWQCADPAADCQGGIPCCGTGTLVLGASAQCANIASGFKGTHCAAACTAGEIVMCTSSSECPTGMTCIPFLTHGNQVGGCM